ncbi:CatA-like O-acetyltransferase [Sneathiella limimaris]|uniref:CatA-like O-acetyltransferase n=1 Tax=Sneathiella limimaris TaxID=1964213 RepID=UPI00146EEBEF|nr:CatA-like O-acetyltransferase [Sneathiella limimaris]
MNIKRVDLDRWSRKEAYHLFRKADFPFLSLTTDINVTPLMTTSRDMRPPLFNFTLFSVMRAINDIPELRMRFDEDGVFEVDRTDPSFTVPINENDFAFCEVPFAENWHEFNKIASERIEAAKTQTKLEDNADALNWTYLSCMPWIHLTGAMHPMMHKDDCIPRIVWGKYIQRGEDWILSLNLQAHHALVDGKHVADFFSKTEDFLAQVP